jgi:cardiolipin synthase
MQVQETAVQTDRIWTIPNVLSMFRLATIPVFAWLVLRGDSDLLAAAVLAVGGLTDYIDGALARRLGQISALGQILDPLADRLSTITVLVVFLITGIMPWWFVALLVSRDLVMAWQMGRLKRVGITGLPVHFVGKLATFLLLLAFPVVLVGAGEGPVAWFFHVVGWALAGWGAGLYWYGAVLYIRQVRGILAGSPDRGRHLEVPPGTRAGL